MKKNFFCWLYKTGQLTIEISEQWLSPVLLFAMRLWIARVFWYSGVQKISDMESTYFLFEYEYQVPLISHKLAAILATGFELLCPVMLVVGLGSRLAAIPLLFMTAVIELTYTSHLDHLYWAFLIAVITLKGPGALSIDAWIKNKINSCQH